MNRLSPAAVCSLVLALGVTGLPRSVTADPAPPLKILLQVPDAVSVPWHLVARAKLEVARIYRDVGVTVVWSDAASTTNPSDPQRSATAPDPGFAVVILSGEITAQLTVATDALGGATGTPERRGRRAYVFYDRVERIARTHLSNGRRRGDYDTDRVIVLGHAIAHEIGHLLLPEGHSATGLMRANWNAQDLRLAVRGELKFTADHAAVIRATLATTSSTLCTSSCLAAQITKGETRPAWADQIEPLTIALRIGASQDVVAHAQAQTPALFGFADRDIRFALKRAVDGAATRLKRRRCQYVLSDFADGGGRTLSTMIEAIGSRPARHSVLFDSSMEAESLNARGENLGVYRDGLSGHPRWRSSVHRCVHAGSRDDQIVVIHESLHALGLGVNPPVSTAITKQVAVRSDG